MKLVPRKNYLDIIQESKQDINDIKLYIDDTYEVRASEIFISFSSDSFIDFQQGMKIPQDHRNDNQLLIKLRYRNGKEVKQFTSESIPITRHIGLSEDSMYPIAIKSLRDRVTTLEEEFARLLNNTKMLKQVVQDIYEEGDII